MSTLTDEERGILIGLEYAKSIKLLEECDKVIQMEMWNMAANRLYYALFHAVSALLISAEIPVGSHKGSHLRFGKHFVQTGIFPPSSGRLYSQMESLRERADYNCAFEAEKDDVLPFYTPSCEMIEQIGEMLKIEKESTDGSNV